MVEVSHKGRNKQAAGLKRLSERANVNPTGPGVNRKVCFSFAAYACNVIAHLEKCHVPISKGLSDEEFQHIQSRFGFNFPPDLRSILQEGLPVGLGFPNWRLSSDKHLLSMINLPVKGLCHEVSKGTFWWNQWGPRPKSTDEAIHIAQKAFKMAPVLVPIYSHCYIPCSPNLAGNPVFFVFEKDVFYCGYDLADFFKREVFIPLNGLSNDSNQQECNETVSRSLQKLSNGREKPFVFKRNMSSINEDMVMEPKVGGYHNHDGHHYSHNHDGHHHHNRGQHHDLNNDGHHCRHHHRHRQAVNEVNLDLLNQRLLAELQNENDRNWWKHGREGPDSWRNHGTTHEEVLSRKSLSEGPLHPLERPPKSLVRSAGNSPRMGQNIMSRYAYFHEQALPTKILAQFTIAAPPWAAKTARHIPLWSDLVESKDNLHDLDLVPTQEFDFNAKLSSVHMRKQADQEVGIAGGKPSKRWLGAYFKDMEKRLRTGGWKEDEIEEMMVAALPPDEEWLSHMQTRREIQDALVKNADAMSSSLQKAGWSVQDVLEILSLQQPNGKYGSKMPNDGKDCLTSNVKKNKKVGGGKLIDFFSQA